MMDDFKRGAFAFVVTVIAIAGSTRAEPPSTLTRIEPGAWELREIDGQGRRSFCVANPAALVRLRESGTGCTRSVFTDEGGSLVANYSCPGTGQGRNLLTVHSPRSIRLETQGIDRGSPFAVDYEGHMVGPCGSAR